MKKMMKRLLTLAALLLCGGAWAADPIAVWYGDYSQTNEGFAIDLNGNKPDADGVITIADGKPIKISWSNATNTNPFGTDHNDGREGQTKVQVLVKYSDLTAPTVANKGAVMVSFTSGTTDQLGNSIIQGGITRGIWANGVYGQGDNYDSVLATSEGKHTYLASYTRYGTDVPGVSGKTFEGTLAFVDGALAYRNTGLKGSYAVDKIYVGGKVGTGANLLSATGMKIYGIALYNTLEDPAGMAVYKFPNELTAATFIKANDTDWENRSIPTGAIETTVAENASFAGNAAYLQYLGDKIATVVHVTDVAEDKVVYGLSAINGQNTGIGTITRDVYLKVSGGTPSVISAGEDSQHDGSNKTKPTGNLLVNVGGTTVAKHVMGAGNRGGSGSKITGNVGVVIEDEANIKGAIIGGWSSPHQNTPEVTGNTTVLIKNVQKVSETLANAPVSNTLPGWVIGGNAYLTNGGGGKVGGDSSVVIALDDDANGEFKKPIVGGSYKTTDNAANAAMTHEGDTTVSISAPNTVTFSGAIYGACYSGNGGKVASVGGNSSVTIDGGTYTGAICAGGNIANYSTVAGTATLTLRSGDFAGATLKGGIATGDKNLVIAGNVTLKPNQAEGFDNIIVTEGDMLTIDVGTALTSSPNSLILVVARKMIDVTRISIPSREGYTLKTLSDDAGMILYLLKDTIREESVVHDLTRFVHYMNNPAVFTWKNSTQSDYFHNSVFSLYSLAECRDTTTYTNGGNAFTTIPGKDGASITFWNIFSSASQSVQPGYVLRLTSDATNKNLDATYNNLHFGGLIVESGATGYTFNSNATANGGTANANRPTDLGDLDKIRETWFEINETVKFARQGRFKLYGTLNLEIAADKELDLNSTLTAVAAWAPELQANSGVRFHGAGQLKVNNLSATNTGVFLDFSDQNKGRTSAVVNGTVTVGANTVVMLPLSMANGGTLKIATTISGDLAASNVKIGDKAVSAERLVIDKATGTIMIAVAKIGEGDSVQYFASIQAAIDVATDEHLDTITIIDQEAEIPADYKLVDGVLVKKVYVAQVYFPEEGLESLEKFETFEAAFCYGSGYVSLLADIELADTFETGVMYQGAFFPFECVIDLNGHALSVAAGEKPVLSIPEGASIEIEATNGGSIGVVRNAGTLYVGGGAISKIVTLPVDANADEDNNSYVQILDAYNGDDVPVIVEWNPAKLNPHVVVNMSAPHLSLYMAEYLDFEGVKFKAATKGYALPDSILGLYAVEPIHKLIPTTIAIEGATVAYEQSAELITIDQVDYLEEGSAISFRIANTSVVGAAVAVNNNEHPMEPIDGIYSIAATREMDSIAITVVADTTVAATITTSDATVSYATLKDAIDAAGDANLGQITIVAPTAEVPTGYRVKGGKVMTTANYYSRWSKTANAAAIVNLKTTASFYDSNFAVFYPETDTESSTFNGNSAGTPQFGGLGNLNRPWYIFASKINGGNNSAYIAPGVTLRFTGDVAGALMDASFAPLSFAGLIVEPGATGFGFKSWNMGSNRGTELGAPNATTHSFIGEDFSIYRAMQGLTIKGTHVLEIDIGKTLHLNDMTVDGHNYTVADYKTVIESGACLKLAGSGTLSVGTLDASGATLDLSETTQIITGNLWVDDSTKLVLPSSVDADEEFVLCTGTLTAPEFPVSTTMTINGEETTVRLTYNAANKSVSYAVDSTVYWTPNTAALDNGILDWTATGAWLAADGITTKSWTEATASTCVRIDAAQVAGVKITGKVTVPEVIVYGTLASPNSFEFHNHTLDVAKDPTTGKDPTTDEEIDCLTVMVVNLSEYTGNLGLKVPIKGQINFGTGTHLIFKTGEAGGDASNAYSYKIVGRAGAIEVAGSGKFQVPSTMYDIPFAPNADATIVYNVADDTEKSVTSPLYNNQGSILKTGAGTLTLTSNIASGVTVTAGEGTLKFTTVGNYEMKGKLVVLSGATLVSTKTDAIGIDTDNVRVDVYGTLDMNGTRWTLSRDHTNDIYFYPGSKVVGLGEGANGAFDNARANKTNLHFVKNEDGTGGTVIFNTEIRFRSDNGYNAGMKIEEDMTVDYVNTVGFRSNAGTLNLTGGGVFNIAAAANITNLSKVKLGLGMTLNVAAGKTVTVEPIDSAAHGIVVIPNQDGSKTYKVAIPSPTTEWGSNDNRSVYLPINDEPSIYVFAGMTLDDIVSGKYELSTWMAGANDSKGNAWLKIPCAGTIFWTDSDASDKTVVFQSQCQNGTLAFSLVQKVQLTEVELGGNTYITARDLGQFYVSGANAYKTLIAGPGTALTLTDHYVECVRLTLTEYITDGTTLSAESLLQPEGGLRIAPNATVTIDGAGAVITPNMELSDGAKLVIDPVRTPMLVNSKVAFGSNAKLSLASEYASVTCGKMTLFTYPTSCTITESAITTAIVDSTSFNNASYTVAVENSPKSGYKRVVLTIGDYASVPETTFLPLGDSITEGYDDGVGETGVPNYRVPLMEMLAAHGYKPVTRGFRTTRNQNAINMTADAAYQNHCGMVGHRILTGFGGGYYGSYRGYAGGYLQGIENYLAQAGEVDYITLLIGTNDIERSPYGEASEETRQQSCDFIFANWKTLIKRVVKQNPTSRVILTTIPVNSTANKEILTQLVNAKIQAYIGSAESVADGIPSEQVTLIDLHTACEGQFIASSPLHPNWNGHIKNAAAWFEGIKTAESKSFVKDTTKLQTKTGIANTIPSTYTKGYVKLAEVNAKNIAKLSSVEANIAKVVSNAGLTLSRVGYYVESQFANQSQTAYLWVDLPVWGEGNKTLSDVSVPTTETTLVRDVVDGIHVYSAGAGVENVEPTDDTVKGIVVRTIKGLNAAAGTVLTAKGEPTPSAAVYDWNDSANAAANWGAWQVFRINTAETGFTSASTLFTFGSYNANNSGNDFGIGDLAKHSESYSMSWIDTGTRYPVLSAGNRAVAKIEIWGKIEGAVIPEAGEAVVVEAQTAEEAIAQTVIVVEDAEADAAAGNGGQAQYLELVATETSEGSGQWTVKAEVKATAVVAGGTKTVQETVEEAAVSFANEGLEAIAGATETTHVDIPAAKVVPGLYYSVSYGTKPDNHTQESKRVLATGSNVTIPVPALGNEKVYYIKIKASATK